MEEVQALEPAPLQPQLWSLGHSAPHGQESKGRRVAWSPALMTSWSPLLDDGHQALQRVVHMSLGTRSTGHMPLRWPYWALMKDLPCQGKSTRRPLTGPSSHGQVVAKGTADCWFLSPGLAGPGVPPVQLGKRTCLLSVSGQEGSGAARPGRRAHRAGEGR